MQGLGATVGRLEREVVVRGVVVGQRERKGRSQAAGKDLSPRYEENEEARSWIGARQTLGERQVRLEDESQSRRWGRSVGRAGRRAAGACGEWRAGCGGVEWIYERGVRRRAQMSK